MRLEKVPWHDVPALWSEAAPMIEAALAHGGGGYKLDDVYASLLARQRTLWRIGDKVLLAVAITQLYAQPRARIFDIEVVGGRDLAAWEHLIEGLEEWALARGCTEVRAHGRLGWRKQAQTYGYELLHAVYRKKLG